MAKIKIAQIIWPSTSLPPKAYGSVQLVASRIIENLDKKKFEVSVLTAKNSKISANIISILDRPILEDKTIPDKNLYLSILIAEIIKRQSEFDLIHSHIGHSTLILAQAIKKPIVITLHGDYTNAHFKNAFKKYGKSIHYVAISKSQQKAFPFETELVYNGLPIEEYGFVNKPKDYAVYVGRTSSFKGLAEAIEVAIKLKIQLKIAAKIDTSPEAVRYFKEKIEPFLTNKYIEFLGELPAKQIKVILKYAKVFLYPISWDEPFGLVVAEAQASGVPVVTYNRGAMQEIIKDNLTGFICSPGDKEGFANAAERVWKFSEIEMKKMRLAARANIADNFNQEQMVEKYEKIYRKVINNCA